MTPATTPGYVSTCILNNTQGFQFIQDFGMICDKETVGLDIDISVKGVFVDCFENLKYVFSHEWLAAGDIDMTKPAHIKVLGDLIKCTYDLVFGEFFSDIYILTQGSRSVDIEDCSVVWLPN